MKKQIGFSIVLLTLFGASATGFGQGAVTHFTPVANTGVTRPVQVETATIQIDGGGNTRLEEGDEIALFDGDLCVGAVRVEPNPQLADSLFPVTFPSILRVITPIDTLPGAVEGNTMSFRIWDQSADAEVKAEATYTEGVGSFGEFLTVVNPLIANAVSINFQIDPATYAFPYSINGHEYTGQQTVLMSIGFTYTLSAEDVPALTGLPAGERYRFEKWNIAGVEDTANTYLYTAPATTQNITVHFQKQHLLTINTQYGTTTGQGWYDEGTVVNFSVDSLTLAVSPGTRRAFNGWTGTGTISYSGNANPATVTMNSPIIEFASWIIEYQLTTTEIPDIGGDIILNPTGGWYTPGTVVTVTANPAAGYQWQTWSGDVPANVNPVAITMTQPKSVTANFVKVFAITIDTQPTGLVFTADGNMYNAPRTFIWIEGSQHSIGVGSPQSGPQGTKYLYTAWSDGGEQSHDISIPSADVTYTAVFKTQHYLDVQTLWGIPSGTGWYDEGSTAPFSVSGTEISGGQGIRYLFTGWTGSGTGTFYVSPNQSGSDSTHTVTMDGPITEVARWDPQYYLETTENPDDGGNITQGPLPPGAWYDANVDVILNAAPVPGYLWAGWTGSITPTTDRPLIVQMNGPKFIIANFGKEVQVTIETQPPDLEFSADGIAYNTTQIFTWIEGSPHTLSAASPQASGPGIQYTYTSWSDGGDTTHIYIVPTSGDSVTVNFKLQYQLTVITDSSTAYGGGWYDVGEEVTFWISPPAITLGLETRYAFSDWQGTGAGSYTGEDTSQTVTMNNPITEVANWATQYLLTLNSEHATTTGAGWHDEGSNVTFSVSPALMPAEEGIRYLFNGWTGTGIGSYTGPNSGQTVQMNNPITEDAGWTTQYFLSTNEDPGEGGDMTPAPPGAWYDAGTEVELTAITALGYLWAGWSGDISSMNNPDTMLMNEPKTVTSNYGTRAEVTIRTQPPGLEFIADGDTFSTEQTFNWIERSQHMLSVESPQAAGQGTRFVYSYWDDGGTQTHSYQVPVLGDTVVVYFVTQYLLTLESTYGTAVGGGWYNEGAEAVFSLETVAIPVGVGKRYKFYVWVGSGAGSYTGPSLVNKITMNNPITEHADWYEQYKLTINSAYGETSGGGWYNTGTYATFSVLSTSIFIDIGIRHFFTDWTGAGAGSYTGPDSAYTVKMDTAITEDATWHTQYRLTTIEEPDEGGNVIPPPPGEWYDTGTQVDITAIPILGYHWVRWGDDLDDVLDNPASLIMNAPKRVTAYFGREVQITIKTEPFQLAFTVDDSTYTQTQTFTWLQGSEHTLSVNSPFDVVNGSRKAFKSWSDGGTQTHLYTAPGDNETVIANFIIQYLLTVNSPYGTPFGGGWYEAGTQATFSVYPHFIQVQSGIQNRFKEWQGTGVNAYSGPDTSHTVTVSNPITETAIWETVNALTLVTTVQPANSGQIRVLPGIGSLYYGNLITVIGIPNSGYFFDHWEGAVTGTSDTAQFVILSDTYVTAHFSRIDLFPPVVYDHFPGNGVVGVPLNNGFELKVKDELSGVNLNTLNVTLSGNLIIQNGVDRTNGNVSIHPITNGYHIVYHPTIYLPAATTITVGVRCQDLAPIPNALDYSYSYTTGYTTIRYTSIVVVTPVGTTITDTSGVVLIIPNNALPYTSTIWIGQMDGFPGFPDYVRSLGPIYYFVPHGIEFVTPIRISLPISGVDFVNSGAASLEDLSILGYNMSTGDWDEIPSEVDITNMVVTFTFTRMGYFRIVAGGQASVTVDGFAEIFNFPNPFNPDLYSTNIVYKLKDNNAISLKIYDVSGRPVRVLEDGVEKLGSRNYTAVWDGRNGMGDRVSNNVYFCILETVDGHRKIRKIAVLR